MRRRWAAAAVALAALTSACTGGGGTPRGTPPASTPGSPSAPSPTLDTLSLVGAWRVSASGESSRTSLILGDELRLFRPCGMLQGEWGADGFGLFIATVDGGDQSCFLGPRADRTAPWLAAATGYREQGPDRLLLDRAGRVVARLAPGAHPTTGPNDDPSLASPPVVTPRPRDQLSDPVPLAPRWQPAGRSDVLGRWRPLGPRAGNPRAHVAFDDRGRWTGSDGCNGAGGRYAVGPAGALLTTSGASTLIGCDNSPVPAWVASARRVALDGAALVLFTGDGRVLGRLARAGSATTSSQASK